MQNKIYIIEDDFHAEHVEKFPSFELALTRLQEFSKITWGEFPNIAPCTNGLNCRRDYIIKEVTNPGTFGKIKVVTTPIFSITAEGLEWNYKNN